MYQRRRPKGESRANTVGPRASYSADQAAVIRASFEAGRTMAEISADLFAACGRTISDPGVRALANRGGWQRGRATGFWTPERVQRVRDLWLKRVSLAESAEILGREFGKPLSASTISGIRSRNGMSAIRPAKPAASTAPKVIRVKAVKAAPKPVVVKPAKPAPAPKPKAPSTFRLQPNFAAAKPATPIVDLPALGSGVSIMALKAGMCKRIFGPAGADSVYCGAPCDMKPAWGQRPGGYPFEPFCPACRVAMGFPAVAIKPPASRFDRRAA